MPENVSLDIVISAFGLMQCLFFAGFLVSLHGRANPANRFLIAFLLIYAINYLDGLFETLGVYRLAPHFLLLADPLDLLLGPLIYFYVDEMINGPWSKGGWRRWRHFILPILVIGLLFMPAFLLPGDTKVQLLVDDAELNDNNVLALGIVHVIALIVGVIAATIFFVAQVTSYLLISIRMLNRHAKRVRDLFSNIERKTLSWLRNLLLLLTAFWLVYAPAEIADLGLVDLSDGFWLAVDVLELLMIYGLGVAALRQPLVFVHKEDLMASHLLEPEPANEADQIPEARQDNNIAQRQKYAKSALDDVDLDRIVAKVTRAMDVDKLFLESDLTLAGLAAHTGISANYISQAINEKLNCHFFDFVNQRRIEAAKERLVEHRDISIMDIALEVGFNAKSTFNAAFKRFAGMTPSQFRQAMKY